MARTRGPRPDPETSAATPLFDGALSERTRTLLDELGQGPSFLEQWIAHYLAELLVRAEDPGAPARARSEARAEIARVVPALWEQQIAREAVQIRNKVDDQLRRTDKLDAEAVELLKGLIANPASAAAVEGREIPRALRVLQDLGELATRFLWTSAMAARTGGGVTSEAVGRFLRRDEELRGLRTALGTVVPAFSELEIADWDAVAALVLQTLIALTQAQLVLLEHAGGDSQPSTKERKKAGGKRQAWRRGRRDST